MARSCCQIDELARRFAIEDVGHSAGVFDQEKLAWMNRHYMKAAAPARLAAESLRYFMKRGFVTRRTDEAMDYISSLLPMAVGSVDRLEEIPDRVRFLFDFDAASALARPEVAEVLHEPGAREVIAALADELAGAGRLDKESFRAAANRVKQRTGQKGRCAVSPDPRRADRSGGRSRTGPRCAGHRSRRGAAGAAARRCRGRIVGERSRVMRFAAARRVCDRTPIESARRS